MTDGKSLNDIKALLFDVDGVMTDNGLFFGEDGNVFKKFCILDGLGIKLAQMAGLKTGVISGHDSNATRLRTERLNMDICEVGVKNKIPVFEKVLGQLELEAKNIAYIGDDYVDVPLLRRVGFSATVPEASDFVKEHCDFVTTRAGGHGAVRDLIEHILKAQGHFDDLMKRFL